MRSTRTSNSEIWVLDTNVLVYAHNLDSPQFQMASELRDKSVRGEIKVCLTPQILYEFFAVVTNPRRVAKPLSALDAIGEVEKYYKSRRIVKIYPKKSTLLRVTELLRNHPVTRGQIFDTHLMATMLENRVTHIYTENTKHFDWHPQLVVVNPFLYPLMKPIGVNE